MEKIKEYKVVFIVVLAILGFSFYWFQLRPTAIKKDCSWFTEIIPADAGISREQADANKKNYEECSSLNNGKITPLTCWRLGQDATERPPKQEKVVTREAKANEYAVCLRNHGL